MLGVMAAPPEACDNLPSEGAVGGTARETMPSFLSDSRRWQVEPCRI